MNRNTQRLFRAECCLDQFALLSGVDNSIDAIVDLIADLGHYADALTLDFLPLIQKAIGHWYCEQILKGEQSIMPTVSITINSRKVITRLDNSLGGEEVVS